MHHHRRASLKCEAVPYIAAPAIQTSSARCRDDDAGVDPVPAPLGHSRRQPAREDRQGQQVDRQRDLELDGLEPDALALEQPRVDRHRRDVGAPSTARSARPPRRTAARRRTGGRRGASVAGKGKRVHRSGLLGTGDEPPGEPEAEKEEEARRAEQEGQRPGRAAPAGAGCPRAAPCGPPRRRRTGRRRGSGPSRPARSPAMVNSAITSAGCRSRRARRTRRRGSAPA